jgi:uroporphyrinogen-III decarboxylase
MDETWTELGPEEKRARRIERFLNPAHARFKSRKAEKRYKERATRLLKVYMCEEPDRVPVSLPSGHFPAYYAGGNLKRVMYDYKALRLAWTKFLHDFKDDMDTVMGPALIHSGRAMEILDMRLIQWPGHGLGDDVNTFQFVEGEYMKADEYDAMIEDPSDFAMRVLLPRLVGSLKAFETLPPYSSLLGMPLGVAAPFTRPEVQKAYQSLIDAGKEMMKREKELMRFNKEALAQGFPSMRGAMAVAPFDAIGDSLRGTNGIIMDMYRQPEKLLEAIDMVTPKAIRRAIHLVNALGGVMVMFPLHKGDDTFMSDEQFDKFYWPSLKKFADALIEEGIMSMMFAEGRYQRRLDIIHDFPKGWVHWMFDQTDMADAKRIVGKTCSISGNVPTSLMCTGTAREVKEYCRKLIETCAPGGGYMLTGGAMATETCPENLRVMMEAAREYGVYK